MTLDELEKLCKEATPGPWERTGTHYVIARYCPIAGTDTLIADTFSTKNGRDLANHQLIAALRNHAEKLIAVAKAAQSVLSEEGVREYLSSYVMGVELMNRLEALEGE